MHPTPHPYHRDACQPGSSPRKVSAIAAAAFAVCAAAQAAEIDVGDPDWALRWDNTVKASTAYRLKNADPALTESFTAQGAPQAINFNAGDQNFKKRGFISERLDLLSEFDAVWRRDSGLRISAAGWYDAAYHRHTDADADPTIGQTPYNAFPGYTRRTAGAKVDLLDAFVFGSANLGAAGKVTGRLGQHTVLFGETLFLGDNGVAAAQGPVDIQKLLSSPNAQFKEIARPVPQLSTQWQIRPELSLSAYVHFKWQSSRVPPSGSYFSSANIPWDATGPEFVGIPLSVPGIGGNYVLQPGADVLPGNGGNWGLQLKWRVAEADLGVFYAKYNDTFGQLYGRLNPGAPVTDSRWFYVFGRAIKVYGVSASQSVGDFNVSAEASIRDHMDLNVNNAIYFGPSVAPMPTLPTGRTAHVNVSALASFGPSFIARESAVVAELAWNRVLSKDDPDNVIDAGRTRDASILQFIFTPTYRQALSGLDLTVPIGLRYTLDGRSSVTAWGPRKTGNLNLGLEGNYLNVWQVAFNYTHYIGAGVPFNDYTAGRFGSGNALADRDYVSMSVRRTF